MIDRVLRRAGALAILGAISLGLGGILDAPQAAFSYLTAFAFGLSLTLGMLSVLMIAHAAHARWFVVMRRLAEICVSTLPTFAVLFLPILLALPLLYPWARPPEELTEHVRSIAERRAGWLNPSAFTTRAVSYFLAWILLSELFFRWSLDQKRDAERTRRRMRALASGGLWPLALTLTFASFDWWMSLDPGWASTIYGIYVFAGSVLGGLALLVLVVWAADAVGPLAGRVTTSHYYALGRLLLAFVMLWAYIAFAQLLVIWMADLPEEVSFYLTRVSSGWVGFSVFLVVGRFALPFFALLSYDLKRRPERLAIVSTWILISHYVDLAWLILPSLHPEGAQPHWLDLAALVLVAGVLVSVACWRARGRPFLPFDDPELGSSLRYRSS